MIEIDPVTEAVISELVEAQKAHPVIEPFTFEELAALGGEEEAYAAVKLRAERILQMEERPLEACWVPEDWWLFLMLLCERRLDMPGSVLEMLISGGIRAGKSYVVAMLMVAHWKFTRRADIFCLSGTQQTSEKLQQQPFNFFLPPEALGEKGSIKQTKHEKAKFSGGKFTDNKFARFLHVTDENDVVYKGGGSVEFRMFSQDPELFKGYSLTSVWWDEKCPVNLVEKCYDRVISRAVETRESWHREKMLALHALLKAQVDKVPGAKRPPVSLLGALMHGVMIGTYTPEEGYVSTVKRYLQGADKPDAHKVIARELAGKPGVADPRVPKIALPVARNRLVGYLHTNANRMVDSYTELSRAAEDWPEALIRIKLYGDVEASEDRLFQSFTDDHIQPWKHVPRDLTIYISCDPAPVKPWTIGIYGVDALGRVWCLMEWPTPGYPVRLGSGEMDPGPWAVATNGENLNGDKGPAAKLRLNYTFTDYTRLIYQVLARCLAQFEATGKPFTGRVVEPGLRWADGFEVPGPFLVPYRVIADKRYLAVTERRGEDVKSNLDWLLEEEHAFDWEVHKDDSQAVGNMAIQRALTARLGGLPGLLVVADKDAQGRITGGCQDTIFALRTYTTEDGKDAPPRGDEACKEAIDRLRYLLKSGPEFSDGQMLRVSGGMAEA